MSSIVYLTNKTTGIKYAYESESFRDPVTHKPKNKRKLDLHIRDSKTACG